MKTVNRTAKARGVSLPKDLNEQVEKKLGTLPPWMRGFSAYVQRLICLDIERNLLKEDGSVNETAMTGAALRPFVKLAAIN